MPNPGDPYLLPNGTLRNRLGITDASELAAAEADIAYAQEGSLRGRLPRPPFGFDTLRAMHRFLFGDVYDWAGEPRTVGLTKNDHEGPDARPTSFTPPGLIAAHAKAIFDELEAEGFLEKLPRKRFATRAARLLVAVNNLHWAREGNGRVQRLLLEAVAHNAGHAIDFRASTRERMIRCSIAGSRGDAKPMERLFHDACDPERAEALRAVARAFQAHGRGMGWNDIYIATTVAGRRYSGILAGEAGDKFMLRVAGDAEGDWIAVGASPDLPSGAARGSPIAFTATRFANSPPDPSGGRRGGRRSPDGSGPT